MMNFSGFGGGGDRNPLQGGGGQGAPYAGLLQTLAQRFMNRNHPNFGGLISQYMNGQHGYQGRLGAGAGGGDTVGTGGTPPTGSGKYNGSIGSIWGDDGNSRGNQHMGPPVNADL